MAARDMRVANNRSASFTIAAVISTRTITSLVEPLTSDPKIKLPFLSRPFPHANLAAKVPPSTYQRPVSSDLTCHFGTRRVGHRVAACGDVGEAGEVAMECPSRTWANVVRTVANCVLVRECGSAR